ncbi:MAG: protein O-GlcNAc transferase, partial [Hyphomicrobiales bacterium]|nr:protein O-GlcNAc transferase [Hyphomicrobiales bacterium]
MSLHQQGRLPEAEKLYAKILKIEPDHFDALHLLGVLKHQQGNAAEALRLIAAALKADATPDAFSNYGNVLCALNRHQEALASYDRALALQPGNVLALTNRGAALNALNRQQEALACYDRALTLQPNSPAIHYNRGNALMSLKRPGEALACYDRALALHPGETGVLLNRGNALAELNRHEEAISCYDGLLALRPGDVEALNNRGTSLASLKRPEAALACYDSVLALTPNHAGAHYNRGNALAQLKRYDEALTSYDAALAIKPDFADALYGRFNALKDARRYQDAIGAYEQAVAVKPDHPDAELGLFDVALALCDWTQTGTLLDKLKAGIAEGKPFRPFTLLGCIDDPSLHRRCAENSIKQAVPDPPAALWKGEKFRHDKIRLAYLSTDLHAHPVAHLIVGLFEQHDRARFEVRAVALDQDDGSDLRRRLVAAFDHFHDMRTKSDHQIAAFLHDRQIDIAVDLSGHTFDARPGILAHRPAPIQASYLGYPGTTGADFIDYVIA